MKYLLSAMLVSIAVAIVALCSRPILPIDETRYVGVAWEAFVTGDWLVSHLNGNTYAHKPPLFFWLINLVWSVFGVSQWGARVVGPMAGLICLPIVYWLARQLWPDQRRVAYFAPWIMASTCLWLLFVPLTMFDALLTLTTLVAISGLLHVLKGRIVLGWLFYGLGMGLGILTKGPVILVSTLPVALLAGWWLRARRVQVLSAMHVSEADTVDGEYDFYGPSWIGWYAGVLAAVVIAAAIGLSWAIPSAVAGGQAYADELLWGQTAGRVTKSFSHQQPFYWYGLALPLGLLPWIFLGTLWRGMQKLTLDWQMKFLISWIAGSLFLFSLISGKQLHYVMPLFPAIALVFARALSSVGLAVRRADVMVLAVGTMVIALMPALFNRLPKFQQLGLAGIVPDYFIPGLLVCGVAIYYLGRSTVERLVGGLATISSVSVSVIMLAGVVNFWDGFRVDGLAEYFARSDKPIVWYGDYHAQLNFAGRMDRIEAAKTSQDLDRWMAENHQGIVVTRLVAKGTAWESLLGTESTQTDEKPTSQQIKLIQEILQERGEFAGLSQPPTPVSVFRIRQGLKKKPYDALALNGSALALNGSDLDGAALESGVMVSGVTDDADQQHSEGRQATRTELEQARESSTKR